MNLCETYAICETWYMPAWCVQQAATHCNAPWRTATHCKKPTHSMLSLMRALYRRPVWCTATHCYTPEHTGTHRNTPQHTATYTTRSTALWRMQCERKRSHSTWPCYCNTLPHAAIRCHTLQHTATRRNTLQHIAILCNIIRQPPGERGRSHSTWPCHPFPLTLKCAKRVKRSILTRKENYEKDLLMQYLTLASISSESEVCETCQTRHVNERDEWT